jgi:hypothetical protein
VAAGNTAAAPPPILELKGTAALALVAGATTTLAAGV